MSTVLEALKIKSCKQLVLRRFRIIVKMGESKTIMVKFTYVF